MLVISRQIDEILRIGSNVKIRILHIQGNRVILGIDAPTEIPVNREELYQQKLSDLDKEVK